MKEWALQNPEGTILLVFLALMAFSVVGTSWAFAFGRRKS